MRILRAILVGSVCGLALGIAMLFHGAPELGSAAQTLAFFWLAGVVACLSLGSAPRWEERFGRVGWYACWMLAGADGFASAGAVFFHQELGGWSWWLLPLTGACLAAYYSRSAGFIIEFLDEEEPLFRSGSWGAGPGQRRPRLFPTPRRSVSELPSTALSGAADGQAAARGGSPAPNARLHGTWDSASPGASDGSATPRP